MECENKVVVRTEISSEKGTKKGKDVVEVIFY